MTEGISAPRPRRQRRGLTRAQIVERALEIGDREGLEAVSVRRVASELGVTSMALYRHVKDKNDLLAAMLDAVMAEVDLTAGILPAMPWQDQVRRLLRNAADAYTARPVILPLQIAYQGPLTANIVRPLESALSILVEAGFSAEDAVSLARTSTLLLAGLLLLAGPDPGAWTPEAAELELMRRRSELTLLELPVEQYPVMRRHARLLADTFVSQGDAWLNQTIELIVAGLDAKLRDSRHSE
ncbi:MAG: TetR family transcriptional regulator [Candidatus Dormibacteraeota bacterium]|nr:TetR family transcriptional regulator [Candidatus Dormibacteraeota bacterium]